MNKQPKTEGKSAFEAPTADIISFNGQADIITASGDENWGEWDPQ